MRPKVRIVSIDRESTGKAQRPQRSTSGDGTRIPWQDGEMVAVSLINAFRTLTDSRISIAGSVRRHKAEGVDDIDILISPYSKEIQSLVTESEVEILWSGMERTSFMFPLEGWSLPLEAIQVDLRFIDPSSWGPAIQYFTGSRKHNISLRSLAKSKGMTLSENGLFLNEKRIDDNTESGVYRSLGLRWLPPWYRNHYLGGYEP